MTTIEVIMLRASRMSGTPDPIILPQHQAVVVGQMFAWSFYVEDPRIQWVQLKFVKAKARFFPGRHRPASRIVREVRFSGKVPGDPGRCVIWGEAPDILSQKTRVDKYIVQGLSRKGKVLAEVDPYIISTEPRPKK